MSWQVCFTALLMLGQPDAPEEDPGLLFRRFVNIRSARGAAMSPDGSQIAFRTNITGVDQVWRLDGPLAWPDQLTFGEDRVMGVSWSPAGDALIFSRDQGGNERPQIHLISPDGTGTKDLTGRPDSIHYFGSFSPDGKRISFVSNRREKAFFDIYVQEVPDGKARLVHQKDGYNRAGPWSPDGKRLVFTTWETNFDSDISILDVESGQATQLTPPDKVARFESAEWGPEGKTIYFVTDLDRDFMSIASIDVKSKEITYLEEPQWDVQGIELSPDRSLMASVINEDGYGRLRLTRIQDGSPVPLPDLPRGLVSGPSFSENGRYLGFAFQGPTSPSDCWRIDLEKSKLERMTRSSLGGLDARKFVEPDLVHYPTFDGKKIPAFLYLPPGSSRDGSLPVIVMAHGGPESQERPRFSTLKQFFLRQGYAVLAPNVRGSTGYGKAFSHLDDVRNRAHSVEDLARGVDFLIENQIGHPKKIAVFGGSYGGFMTLASLTTFPEKFAAGIDIVGIANFKTFLERTGPWRRKLREAEYGSLEKDAEFLEKISPLNHVERIVAPLLVIQGANDPRVPMEEAEQIVSALKERGMPVEYILFEDEGHGIAKLKNRVIAYSRIMSFLDTHVRSVSE